MWHDTCPVVLAGGAVTGVRGIDEAEVVHDLVVLHQAVGHPRPQAHALRPGRRDADQKREHDDESE